MKTMRFLAYYSITYVLHEKISKIMKKFVLQLIKKKRVWLWKNLIVKNGFDKTQFEKKNIGKETKKIFLVSSVVR